MEDRWHGPEDPTNEEPETTRKKRRGTDFLSQYLLRRREQQGEHVEEDDDEESDEKPKKFRRFFRGLFKNVVAPPADSEASPKKHLGLESLFTSSEKEEPNLENESDAENIEQPTFQPETPEPEDISLPPEERKIQMESVEANSVEETEKKSPVKEGDTSVTNEMQPEAVQETPETSYRPLIPTAEQDRDRTVFERTQTQPVEKEVVIERGPGMALPVVLVGAEYLARKKADRKLDAKYNEKVTRLETENKRTNIATEQLDNLVRQNREQLESLKRERGIAVPIPERRSEQRSEQTVERSVTRVERQQSAELPKPPVSPEISSQPKPEKPEVPETYKIMEQVAEAAEHNVPVERVFERSHEVKDDQTVPVVGAASVGAIMAAKAATRQPTIQSGARSSEPTDTNGLPVVYDKPAGDMYKQAMQRGFWAAVVLIIFGILAYLLK